MVKDYGIVSNSTVILNMGLLEGCSRSSSKGLASFNDAFKGKVEPQKNPEQLPNLPGPHIVE